MYSACTQELQNQEDENGIILECFSHSMQTGMSVVYSYKLVFAQHKLRLHTAHAQSSTCKWSHCERRYVLWLKKTVLIMLLTCCYAKMLKRSPPQDSLSFWNKALAIENVEISFRFSLNTRTLLYSQYVHILEQVPPQITYVTLLVNLYVQLCGRTPEIDTTTHLL